MRQMRHVEGCLIREKWDRPMSQKLWIALGLVGHIITVQLAHDESPSRESGKPGRLTTIRGTQPRDK